MRASHLPSPTLDEYLRLVATVHPQLHAVLDFDRPGAARALGVLAATSSEFDSDRDGRGDPYRRAQQDALVRWTGIRAPLGLHDFDDSGPMAGFFAQVVHPHAAGGHAYRHFTRPGLSALFADAGLPVRVLDLYDPLIVRAGSERAAGARRTGPLRRPPARRAVRGGGPENGPGRPVHQTDRPPPGVNRRSALAALRGELAREDA
ncbi:hypothetical protein [Nonomuraea sp. NPDC049758]|uniref:hypothetical protein n=1 Tax=Nonomuraea sp. NPDC049758 TaxID=3154360 RepID=UPI00341A6284